MNPLSPARLVRQSLNHHIANQAASLNYLCNDRIWLHLAAAWQLQGFRKFDSNSFMLLLIPSHCDCGPQPRVREHLPRSWSPKVINNTPEGFPTASLVVRLAKIDSLNKLADGTILCYPITEIFTTFVSGLVVSRRDVWSLFRFYLLRAANTWTSSDRFNLSQNIERVANFVPVI